MGWDNCCPTRRIPAGRYLCGQLRFGSELVFFICKRLGVTVTILDTPAEKSMEETFTQDVLAVLNVFSAKLYAARSHRPKAPPLTT